MPRGKERVKSINFDLKTTFWLSLGLLFILMFIFSGNSSGVSKNEVMMTIDFGDGTKRNFSTTIKNDLSAWDLLQQANAAYDIPVEIEGNFEPRKIGEMANGESGKEWNFYINGKLRQESPFDMRLSGGERILFKFE